MDMQVMDVRPVTLEGAQVRLEPLTKAHHAALAPLIDSTLLQWFTKPATDAAGLREFIATALEEQAESRGLPFAIVDRAVDRPVGSTRFANIDRANRRLEI